MKIDNEVGEFRPEFGLEGEQQDQAHCHGGREEEERQRGRAGKIKGQDYQVHGEQAQEQRADARRDMAIRVQRSPRKCVQMAATIASRKVGYKKTILG